MCGIIGYVGEAAAAPILLDGLRRLQYRGYDSAGVAVLQGRSVAVRRRVGKLVHLEQALVAEPLIGTIGIGHTRWATHGIPSEENAHPHQSDGCVVVHNGILENYLALKQQLLDEGFRFSSETDTEVVAHLVSSYLQKGLVLEDAVRAAVGHIHGSYAFVLMSEHAPDRLIAASGGCPLLLGQTALASVVASDCTAILPHSRQVVPLQPGDVAVLTKASIVVMDPAGSVATRGLHYIEWDAAAAEKGGYAHFMLKEIHEQPRALLDTLRGRYDRESGELDGAEMGLSAAQLAKVSRIWIVACGTSWHAGLVGKYVIEQWCRVLVQVEISSEFRYRDPLIGPGDLVIAISQSGETADTLAAVREAKRKGASIISIVNVVGSTLVQESDGTIFTRCGPEIGVASTKAFTAQLLALYLLAVHIARGLGTLSPEDSRAWLASLEQLPTLIEQILEREVELMAIALRFAQKRNFLYLGRGINYPLALEGALKLKEISYLSAEGYPAGEMKHGPIALIDEETPVVMLVPQDHVYEKTVGNLMEVKARRAPVIALVSEDDHELIKLADAAFAIPDVPSMLTPILFAVPMQLLAYHIAVLRGTEVDQPRNLAKSVTVE